MIRELNTNHLQQCVEIAFLRNSQPESNSAYCPKTEKGIQGDFEFLMDTPNNSMFGYFNGDTLEGILGCFVNPDNNWVDCSGPFFRGEWNQDAAKDMLAYAKTKHTQAVRFNFYFDTRNKNLHQLLESLHAQRNDNEYVLLLKKSDYKPQQIKHNVVAYSENFKNDILQLKNGTWPDAYLTDNDLFNSISKDREVFCALGQNGAFVGYGVLKRYGNDTSRMTAEVFAVAEGARGKGYGWALLNTVVDCALNKYDADSIDLIVDRLNTNARDLYYSCGFKLLVENASYCITITYSK